MTQARTPHLALIRERLGHLERMEGCLAYSLSKVAAIVPRIGAEVLSADDHESLAAFRVRFSDFQEHLGKAMRAVAIEEALDVDRFGTVLALMERLGILDSEEQWRTIRDLRNAVNHEYEDDTARLGEFFTGLTAAAPAPMAMRGRLARFCSKAYGFSAQASG